LFNRSDVVRSLKPVRALAIREKALGPDYPDVATVCENMAGLYKKIGKEDQAERLEERAIKIRSNQWR
jgi:Tfp pilus assembly protein PilF